MIDQAAARDFVASGSWVRGESEQLRIHATLGLPSLLFNALILKWTADMNPSLVVTSYHDALFGVLVMTAVAPSVTGWLGLDEAYPLVQNLLYLLGRRWGPPAAPGYRMSAPPLMWRTWPVM